MFVAICLYPVILMEVSLVFELDLVFGNFTEFNETEERRYSVIGQERQRDGKDFALGISTEALFMSCHPSNPEAIFTPLILLYSCLAELCKNNDKITGTQDRARRHIILFRCADMNKAIMEMGT